YERPARRLRDRQREGARRAPRARVGGRRPRLGAARDAADAHEPRGDLPQPHDAGCRGGAARAGTSVGGDNRGGAVNNIFAIANKELRSYFSTPIAYIVIGFFALLFGYFFYAMVFIFNQQSQLGGLEGGGAADMNAQLIRPLFLNASV